MKSRHLARSLAMQTLYSLDFSHQLYDDEGNSMHEALASADIPFAGISAEEEAQLEMDIRYYASFLIHGTLENLDRIDGLIERYSTNRPLDRINIVDRNILRISFYSLLFCPDVHPHIVIDEAVKLSQEFSSDRNYKFVNGVLDSYARQTREAAGDDRA